MISNYSVDKYPYVEAPNYFDINSIIESFPHLKDINADRDWTELNNAEGLIIRSANDDNVHKVYLLLFRASNMEYGPPLPRIASNFNKHS